MKSKEKSLDFGGNLYAHTKHKAELRRSIAHGKGDYSRELCLGGHPLN
jgi:hypothetical protein